MIPLEWKKGEEPEESGKEEERRLFYVGMTRARDQLILVTGKEESEFLSAIPGDCVERENAAGSGREQDIKQLSLFDWIQ